MRAVRPHYLRGCCGSVVPAVTGNSNVIARVVACAAILALTPWWSTLRAETRVPIHVPPEICDLTVSAARETGDVTIAWSGGKAPFVVVRSDAKDFRVSKRLEVIASGLRSTQFVDRGAYRAGKRLYYQIYDPNSMPEVFGFSPDGGLPGAEIRVRGVGFRSDCAKITVEVAGSEAPIKLDCSFLGFTFKVPPNAMTGSLIVATPAGAALAGDTGTELQPICHGVPRTPRSW